MGKKIISVDELLRISFKAYVRKFGDVPCINKNIEAYLFTKFDKFTIYTTRGVN